MAKKPAPDSTGMKQGGAARFRPGQSGNPKGRPKGSRNKLGEDFLTDMLEVWGGKARVPSRPRRAITRKSWCRSSPVSYPKS